MSQSRVHGLSRRRILSGMAAGATAVGAGTLFPLRRGWAGARTIHNYADLEAIVVSDGHFVLPTGFLVSPDSPAAEQGSSLESSGTDGRPVSARQQCRRDQAAIGPDPGRRGHRGRATSQPRESWQKISKPPASSLPT
jgi:hypothetical protein